MDRNREARRASIVGSNGFNKRRHRTNSLRDSPDEDGGLELHESVRLRDRVKKERDRERDRDREREREREREKERERDLRERSSRSKRRRGERLTSNREEIGGDETSEEESLNDDEDDDDEENTITAGAGGVRLLSQAVGSVPNHHYHGHSNHHHSHSSSFIQHITNSSSNTVSSNHLQHRKSFPPNSSSAKISRAPPVWKSGDEMISVPVPRKARSASTKRSHDWMSIGSNNISGSGISGVEQNIVQPSSSPARQGVVPTSTPTPPHPPMSPTSSNASIRKKLKPTANSSAQKLKPPKPAAKPSSNSSNPEELEIEIAEVLYGLMIQSQAPSTKKEESREINRLSSDAKSRNSSPISNSTSAINPISGSNSGPLSAVAPKRKRPRQIPENSSYGARNSPILAKPDADQVPKTEKISEAADNEYQMAGNSVDPQSPAQASPPSAPTLLESAKMGSELKPAAEELTESRGSVAKGEMSSPKEKVSQAGRAEVSLKGDSPPAVMASSGPATTEANSITAKIEHRKEEKFEIDLMAPPPQVRPSPDRETKTDSKDSPVDKKPVISISDANLKPALENEADENGKSGRFYPPAEEKKVKAAGEEAEMNKAIDDKKRNVDLHLDIENSERDGGDAVNAAGNGNKSQSLTQKQPQALTEKSGLSTSSSPMSMASWPGGLPPMGYMAPLQGVVSMEGGTAAPGHLPPVFTQPRPKRCATHCHIARNIHYLQQLMKMNSFWPAPAASASLFGSKPCNLNVIPGADMHVNASVRGANSAQDKGQNVVANNIAKDKVTSDSVQRKQQILLQQALPPVAPSNLLGPAFIFPLNQQQSATPRPGGAKSPATAGVSTSTSGSAVASSSSAAAVSFNYPNMASNETQYLAIVQNNGYTFPIPAAAVGAPQNYRSNPAQAMPLFNAPFYSSQMIHPSQLQHAQPPSIQTQLLQPHHNAGASSGSSASQKHLQSQQQRIQSGGISSTGTASLQNMSSQKTPASQQSHNQFVHQTRPRHHEGEPGREDSPSTTDSRGSRASMNIYGQNFAIPIHPQNFGLMTHAAALASAGGAATATSASSNHADKKGHQPQQQGSKTGPDSLPAHSFAMTFGTMNGASGQGIDMSSMAQNHAIFQNSSEVMRQSMGAAQKNGKSGGNDSSATDEEAKSSSGKALGGGAQSITFTRSDLGDGRARSITANPHVQNAHNIQAQLQQQHMLQLKQQQLQQQMAANSVGRSKVGVNSNGGMYSEHLNSSSKFPNALSGFPQNLVQSNSSGSSPSQSPQWKASARTSTSQTPSLAASNTTTLKNLPQQHSRTQISFGGNPKPTAASQGQATPNNNQTSSSQMMVGSPTSSSVSKGPNGSPRASSSSTNNKTSHTSSQPSKNSPSVPNQKSPSILGNPHAVAAAAASSVQKSQMQQQSQQQMPKAMQQQQLFFSNPYAQTQSPHSSGKGSTTSAASGYYMTRRQTDQHQQSPVTSGGGLSLCPPVTLGGTTTNDPATAIAAATANMKGGGLPSQGIIHASQFPTQPVLPAGFSYAHPVPAAVQAKPAQQKQPAGNDNLHQWQPEKK